MSKFDSTVIDQWTLMVERFIIDHYGISRMGVRVGADAWELVHRSGIVREAYKDRTVVDAHIVTALKKIFPNAIFKDKYQY